jgi:cytochrome P450
MADARPFYEQPEFFADPYPTYHRWRTEAPVQWNAPLNGWLVTSHDAVTAALADPRLSADRTESYLARYPVEARAELVPFAQMRSDMILFIDPPKHTRLRGLVQKAFTPRAIGLLRPRIEQLVIELLAPAEAGGAFDIITGLAEPLPGLVIAELLGVPPADRPQFKRWALDMATALSGAASLDQVRQAQTSLLAMGEYLRHVAAERRAQPEDDLISALVAVEEQGEILNEHELLATCALLLIAGSETTTNLIGNGLLALLKHPDQLARLRAEGELIRTAVEELLRYDSPVQATFRVVGEATSIDGVAIAPGQLVVLLVAAANRDPAQFPEPDRLDLSRANRRHLSFSHGPHFCLGAALARLEGQIAIAMTLNRLPAVRLVDQPPAWRPLFAFRGLQSLPVEC